MADELAAIRARLAALSSDSKPVVPVVEEEKNDNAAEKVDKPDNEKSICVTHLDISVTEDKLQTFFGSCGQIKKIFIKRDPRTHKPKGYAYIEFVNINSVQNALTLNDKLFCGQNIKVAQKRENKPGMSRRPRGPRRFRQ